MRIPTKRMLGLILLLVAVVVGMLLWSIVEIRDFRSRRGVPAGNPMGAVAHNPIYVAALARVPLPEFESVVQSNLPSLNVKDQGLGTDPPSVLSVCAGLDLTNHVRLLIAYGADVTEATNYLHKYGAKKELSLITICVSGAADLKTPSTLPKPGPSP
jgi:hypothetical protein